ncbi:MAG: hypothetical protein JO188_13915 [Hyphomicrobiales bacterium]|nr:hypothetical protein [Hyphomicrobiales bacterium]
MRFRAFLFVAAALFLLGAPCTKAFPQRKVVDWIADLYTAQASRISKGETIDESELRALFVPELAEIWQAAHRHGTPAVSEEQALDAFFGWKVSPGAKVSFTAVSQVLGTAEAPTLLIDVVVSGTPRRIVLDAVESEGSWRIANIAYDEGEDFISFERKHARP